MEANQIIDLKQIVCREFDIQELWKEYICHPNHRMIIWSWAIRKPEIIAKNKCLKFRVSGQYHKGHVYIVLNVLDYFDIYFTTIHGVIKTVRKDICIDELIEVLDNVIENK